ncbi:MAG: type II toxin-antitoxin system HicA family toxin [Candidatus Melainabacteria bacterium]|jgi:predicted RNA binding protein YcfA (HicA-like mRNA interferase family)
MKSLSGKDFAKLLQKKGWNCIRINGSHHIFEKVGVIQKTSLPIHSNQSLKPGIQRFFMKIAGILEKDL